MITIIFQCPCPCTTTIDYEHLFNTSPQISTSCLYKKKSLKLNILCFLSNFFEINLQIYKWQTLLNLLRSTVFWTKNYFLNISEKFAFVIHVPICRSFQLSLLFLISIWKEKSPCNCKEMCKHSPIRTKFMAIDNKSGKHIEKYETCWAK